MMSEPVAVQGDASLVTSTVTSEPETTSINNNNNNNNNVSNNNNNSPSNCKGMAGKKEGKLPPCSSISNSSFLWDPDVDGEMVNMPLAPQLITEVPPGEELDDLTELIGPELATLVTATPDNKSMTIIHTTDGGHFPVDVANCNYNPDNFSQNIDFDKLWGDYTASEQPNLVNTGPHPAQNQTFRKVIIARKMGPGAPGVAPGHPGALRSEDNNNNSDIVRANTNELVIGIGEPGSKALLLQHRDSRSESQQPDNRNVVSSRTASGDSVTLTVVRGDPAGIRGVASPSNGGYGSQLARRQHNTPILSGARHYQMGIKSEYIDVMGPVFCHTVRPLLVRRNLWTLELEEVWLCLFKRICHTMKKGFPKEKRKASKFLRHKIDSVPSAL